MSVPDNFEDFRHAVEPLQPAVLDLQRRITRRGFDIELVLPALAAQGAVFARLAFDLETLTRIGRFAYRIAQAVQRPGSGSESSIPLDLRVEEIVAMNTRLQPIVLGWAQHHFLQEKGLPIGTVVVGIQLTCARLAVQLGASLSDFLGVATGAYETDPSDVS